MSGAYTDYPLDQDQNGSDLSDEAEARVAVLRERLAESVDRTEAALRAHAPRVHWRGRVWARIVAILKSQTLPN